MMVNTKNKTGKTVKQRGFPHAICSRTWCRSTPHPIPPVLGKFFYVPSASSCHPLLSASDSGFPEILTPSRLNKESPIQLQTNQPLDPH